MNKIMTNTTASIMLSLFYVNNLYYSTACTCVIIKYTAIFEPLEISTIEQKYIIKEKIGDRQVVL